MQSFDDLCEQLFLRRFLNAVLVSVVSCVLLSEFWNWDLLSPLAGFTGLFSNFDRKFFLSISNVSILYGQFICVKNQKNIVLIPALWAFASLLFGIWNHYTDVFIQLEGVHLSAIFLRNFLYFSIFGVVCFFSHSFLLKFSSVEYVYLTSLKFRIGQIFYQSFLLSLGYMLVFGTVYFFLQSSIIGLFESFLLLLFR